MISVSYYSCCFSIDNNSSVDRKSDNCYGNDIYNNNNDQQLMVIVI